MKTYEAKRSPIIKNTLMIGSILLLALLLVNGTMLLDRPGLLVLVVGSILISIWYYRGTYYSIDEEYFSYKAGPSKGKIYIPKIKELVTGKSLGFGTKPALASGGVIIKFNNYSEVYVAPINNEELIEDILAVNPSILVNGIPPELRSVVK